MFTSALSFHERQAAQANNVSVRPSLHAAATAHHLPVTCSAASPGALWPLLYWFLLVLLVLRAVAVLAAAFCHHDRGREVSSVL